MGGRATFPWQFFRNPARNADSERAQSALVLASTDTVNEKHQPRLKEKL